VQDIAIFLFHNFSTRNIKNQQMSNTKAFKRKYKKSAEVFIFKTIHKHHKKQEKGRKHLISFSRIDFKYLIITQIMII
jgi:hypothetical protein